MVSAVKVQVLVTLEVAENVHIPEAMKYLIDVPLLMGRHAGETVVCKIVSIDGEVAPYTQPT